MEKPLIIGITASPRSVLRNENIESIFDSVSDELELKSLLQELGHFKRKISNSDGALIAAFFGAKHFKSDFLLFNLQDAFNLSNNKNLTKSLQNKELLFKSIKKADGIIISTPVFFGDCSSYVYELLGIINEEEYAILNDKIVGVLSSGAKRNGGQETTNIFTLCEFFRMGANIIGNGPPTSQFGGTIWAGDKGEIGEDSLGIETAVGTGKKMGEILNIFNLYNNNNKSGESFVDIYLNLALILPAKELLSERMKQEIEKLIQKIFNDTFGKNKISLKINYIEIYGNDIKKCLGCNKCPPPKNNFNCIIDDKINSIRNVLLNSDSILFVNYLKNNRNIETWINFKVFFERTRHLRHNNFELTNKPVGIITLIDGDYMLKPNSIDIKFITYFLRHNTICVGPPVFAVTDNTFELSNITGQFNKKFYDSSKTMLSKLLKLSHIMKTTGYKNSKIPLYIPYGFGKFKNH